MDNRYNSDEKNDPNYVFREFFKKIIETDLIAGKFAKAGGLEGHFKSVRKVAETFEILLEPEFCKGTFNVMMVYFYKPFMNQPGIARFCRDEVNYYMERAKNFGAFDKPFLPS